MATIELVIIIADIVVIVVISPITVDYIRPGRVVQLDTTLSFDISSTTIDMLVFIIDSASSGNPCLSFCRQVKN